MTRVGKQIFLLKMGIYLIAAVAIFISVYPLFIIFLVSVRPRIYSFTLPPVYIFKPTLVHYKETFLWHSALPRSLWNSIVISLSSTAITVTAGSLAAFAFSRFSFRIRDFLLQWVLTNRMFPAMAVVLPFFIIFSRLGLYDTRLAVIITHTIFNLPLAIWLMKSFFDDIPAELDEVARIDGCSRLGAFFRVALPLSTSGLAATAILCFLFSWNDYLFAVILTSIKARPILVATQGLMSYQGMRWGQLGSLCTIIIIPAIIVVLFLQKYIVRGLTFGAVKE